MWSLFKKHLKLLLLSLTILFLCALIQYATFSGLMKNCVDYRYYVAHWEYSDTFKEVILMISIPDINVPNFSYDWYKIYDRYKIYDWYKVIDTWEEIPLWVTEAQTNIVVEQRTPILTDLLSKTLYTPLVVCVLILFPILIMAPIERDYMPNKSILTFLRIPKPRSRYLMEKLFIPLVFVFLFWSVQFGVAVAQTAMYFYTVPEAVRPVGVSPWAFDYYRTLFPVVEPIWFPATICALCLIPLVIVTFVFIAKGGMKSWLYGILPLLGAITVVFTVYRVSNMWWITPIILISVYLNGRMLLNRGQIVQ